jgi:hypothetical protein
MDRFLMREPQSMSWLLSEVSRQVEEWRQKDTSEQRPGDEGKLKGQ